MAAHPLGVIVVGLSCAGVGAAIMTVAGTELASGSPAAEEPVEVVEQPLTIEDRYQQLDQLRLDCATGAGAACNALGLAHETREDLWGHPVKGEGVKRDNRKAAHYFRLACDYKLEEGCRNIGRLYEIGKGVSKDPGEAARYEARACVLHDGGECDAKTEAPASGAGLALRP
jgi:TPR repeat protein